MPRDLSSHVYSAWSIPDAYSVWQIVTGPRQPSNVSFTSHCNKRAFNSFRCFVSSLFRFAFNFLSYLGEKFSRNGYRIYRLIFSITWSATLQVSNKATVNFVFFFFLFFGIHWSATIDYLILMDNFYWNFYGDSTPRISDLPTSIRKGGLRHSWKSYRSIGGLWRGWPNFGPGGGREGRRERELLGTRAN